MTVFQRKRRPAENQVALGEHLWFFASPLGPNHPQCLIMAHGGYTIGRGVFLVPAGVTMHFYAPHGSTLVNPSVQTQILENHSAAIHDLGPGRECYRYELGKVLGHGADDGGGEYYQSVSRWMEDATERYGNPRKDGLPPYWAPHIVSVRNRGNRRQTVELESLIEQVRAHNNAVTHFYFLACRAKFTARRGGRRGRLVEAVDYFV
jgi:hypothetical protein